ncbi:uncharacterized protein BCR38DRAFT_423239 [Pseudomassariella vexata]|uniref:ER transporter 6TM N-terminal domain-containing protein n=1 Tax=Pseudomassariella vexata TaxID=1141098 RepID=A0A1Y2EAV8_9PEZI|nr:uncharacterized protein BCR38DRAFT_423239 [Pseudomassariella vexata]ORY68434.1 hypothetical protein BCR38DRAFT_423239 [Pseudomassariella vexata]
MSSNPAPPSLNGEEHRSNEEDQKQPEVINGHHGGRDDAAAASAPAAPTKPAKPGIVARLGLDLGTVLMMVKGAIPPTIAIAMYQSTAVATQFTTLGYLVGIISILSLSILPRGKFIQTLLLNVIFVCLGAAMAVLILWSSLQARLHTQSSPADLAAGFPGYNSSQAAVSGLWLFANIWFVNVLRAKFPMLNVPVIVFSILTMISCTFSPLMTSNAAFEALVKRILTAMLAAFGIAAGCSLLIFPMSSRKVTFLQMKGGLMLLRGALQQETVYLQSLEREDMFAVPADVSGAVDPKEGDKNHTKAGPITTPEVRALQQTIASIRELAGKIQTDLPFAKRDFAYGKLDSHDLKAIFCCFRSCFIPVIGISTVIDIFQRIAERRGWTTDELTPPEVVAEKNEEKRIWNEIMKQLHEPCQLLAEAMDQGLEHAGIQLEILPKPPSTTKAKKAAAFETDADVEAKGDLVQPGDPAFAEALAQKVRKFAHMKHGILQNWAKERGLMRDEALLQDGNRIPLSHGGVKHEHNQSQLFVLLYLEKLMQEAGQAVLNFVTFADEKVASGSMDKNRLIIPKYKILKKWASSTFNDQAGSAENNGDLFDTGNIVYMGEGFAAKKDPEHLPPANAWQRFGDGLRIVSKFFGSAESAFAFRVACATMTIGIAAFLESTWHFFQTQRLVWAMIIIAIGMTETSGQSIFGFLCRIGGTFVAMVLSIINWYIVDEHTAGVLVFLFLFLVIEHYFFLKYPQLLPAVLMCMITHVLIIGYELQVVKIGIDASESSNQPFYPVYELAPYRLATVAAGCLVAFIWTIFPTPLTERGFLRRDLASTMYLLASYHSVVNESLKAKMRNDAGDPGLKTTPAHRLAKHRHHIFGKLMLILPALKSHANFQRWEPTIGGRFPRELYEDIILRSTRITSYLTLVSHTVTWTPDPSASDRSWIEALSVLLQDIAPTQHTIVCTLALLSNALESGHSLPPHIPLPRPYELTRQLEALAYGKDDKRPLGLLDARNMAENGYAEFAVLQVCNTLVCDDLQGLVKSVGKLVGVVDFSFRVEGANSGSLSSSSSSLGIDRVPTGTRRDSDPYKQKVH